MPALMIPGEIPFDPADRLHRHPVGEHRDHDPSLGPALRGGGRRVGCIRRQDGGRNGGGWLASPSMAGADRTFAKFTFFKLDPAWQRRDAEARAQDKAEFLAACEDYAQDRSLRAYSTVGTRGRHRPPAAQPEPACSRTSTPSTSSSRRAGWRSG